MKKFNSSLILSDVQFRQFDNEFQVFDFFAAKKSFLQQLPDFIEAIRNALVLDFPHKNGERKVKPPYCSFQLLLCAIQREKSLITITPKIASQMKQIPKNYKVEFPKQEPSIREIKSNLLDEKLDWCLGYGCLDKKNIHDSEYPLREGKYRQFKNQIKFAARRYAELFAEWHPGKKLSTAPLDHAEYGIAKNYVPATAAEWALLEYNPRFAGLELTGQLYQQFFGKSGNAFIRRFSTRGDGKGTVRNL